jgi:hypothetical protein
MENKTTIIQQFPSMADAFEWVQFKMLDATVGNITTKHQYQGTDAVIGYCGEITYVGLFNLVELC